MIDKKLLNNLTSTGIIQIANFAVPLISVPLITRIIGPDKFGAINYASAYVVYFNMFISYGFSLTAIRRLNMHPNDKYWRDKVFSEILLSQLILFIISVFLFMFLLFNIPRLELDKRLFVYSMLSCISSVLTQYWVFQAMQKLSIVAVVNLLGKVIYLVLIALLLRVKEDYYYQPLFLSLSHIVIGLVSFVWAKKKYNITIKWIPTMQCLKILWEEKSVFFTMTFTTLYTTGNIFILGCFQNDEQVGYFTAGQKLIIIIQSIIIIPLSQVFYPMINKAFSENVNNGIKIVQKLIPVTIVFTLGITAGMIIFGPDCLVLFYGKNFAPAILIFQILTLIPFITALSSIVGVQLLLNLKKDSQYLKIISICSVFSLISNIYMVWKWGYVACAINWILTEIFILVILLAYTKTIGVNPFIKEYFYETVSPTRFMKLKSNIFNR